MQVCVLLGFLVLSITGCFLVAGHMVPEDRSSGGRNSTNTLLATGSDSAPIVIVELPRTVRRNKTDKQKKNKLTVKKKKHPPPLSNCVPLWGSCKSPNNTCCDFCAFCQCRLFKTVCYCRMGNPRC